MNSNQNLNFNEKIENSETQEEIDLKKLFDMFWRNKKIIGLFGLTGLIVSGVITLNTKKVWKGDFQIVLEIPKPKRSIGSFDKGFETFVGLPSTVNTLETEVVILKSPSVLIDVFDFLKTQKALKSKDSMEGLRFKSWQRSSLNVALKKNTSILNIAYTDTDKDLILPVLNRISSTYKEFSKNRRTRSIDLALDYFNKQISLYKNKSIESLRKSQQFAIDQDLTIPGNESEIDIESPISLNVENIRLTSANKIRFINQQLDQIEDLKDQSNQIIYVSSTIPALADLSNELKDLENKLSNSRRIYTENDKEIQSLIKKRIFLIDHLKRQVKGFLIAAKTDAQSMIKAAERPEGVIIEYKMLLNNALKDEDTLDNLENQYRALLLEKARGDDPWKLITNPTLIPSPVAPNKKQALAFGLFSGIFLGSGAALIYENRKNIIYSASDLEPLCKWPLLVELSVNEQRSWVESFDLLFSGDILNTEGTTALIIIGEINESLVKEIAQSLKQFLKGKELVVTKNLREVKKCSNLLAVTALGITKREELIEVRKKLLWQKKSVLGLLALKNIKLKT
tara:strand:- start:6485 stop:8188 length:1704 start_codon:yes stop_codon:yes gene_type:complete